VITDAESDRLRSVSELFHARFDFKRYGKYLPMARDPMILEVE